MMNGWENDGDDIIGTASAKFEAPMIFSSYSSSKKKYSPRKQFIQRRNLNRVSKHVRRKTPKRKNKPFPKNSLKVLRKIYSSGDMKPGSSRSFPPPMRRARSLGSGLILKKKAKESKVSALMEKIEYLENKLKHSQQQRRKDLRNLRKKKKAKEGQCEKMKEEKEDLKEKLQNSRKILFRKNKEIRALFKGRKLDTLPKPETDDGDSLTKNGSAPRSLTSRIGDGSHTKKGSVTKSLKTRPLSVRPRSVEKRRKTRVSKEGKSLPMNCSDIVLNKKLRQMRKIISFQKREKRRLNLHGKKLKNTIERHERLESSLRKQLEASKHTISKLKKSEKKLKSENDRHSKENHQLLHKLGLLENEFGQKVDDERRLALEVEKLKKTIRLATEQIAKLEREKDIGVTRVVGNYQAAPIMGSRMRKKRFRGRKQDMSTSELEMELAPLNPTRGTANGRYVKEEKKPKTRRKRSKGILSVKELELELEPVRPGKGRYVLPSPLEPIDELEVKNEKISGLVEREREVEDEDDDDDDDYFGDFEGFDDDFSGFS